ncbi:ABC transporter substrate-binding protein [Paenibacillus sp. FA6]|uniref:ABC transporter substrate-binding protein n=1 Tax=Paenibacillus sp. FA6 TaxID=3413029 RepID=UPI003F65E0CA
MKKIMGSLLSLTMAGILLVGCGNGQNNDSAAGQEQAEGKPTQLVISTWGFSEDFFNKEVYAPFEKEHNVKIVTEIGNNAERLNKIRQGSGNVDVVYLSDYYAQQAINEGLFEQMDHSKIPNVEQVYDIAKAPLGEEYGPAFTIGRLGIAYNPDLIKQSVTSWGDLWSDEFKNNVTTPNITTTAGPMFVSVASTVAGNEQFNEDAAFAKLKELNPGIVKYYGQTSEFVNMFSQEEIAGGPIMEMYMKDLKAAIPNAVFVSPKEGAYAVMNTVNIVKGSKNKELAEQFINWHLSKEVQEKSAKAKVDSPVNTEVVLNAEEADGVTYGADVVNNLLKLDMKFVNDNIKTWTDRWNRELAQ